MLATLAVDLSGHGIADPKWCESVRMPSFGHIQRRNHTDLPGDQDLSRYCAEFFARYGPPPSSEHSN